MINQSDVDFMLDYFDSMILFYEMKNSSEPVDGAVFNSLDRKVCGQENIGRLGDCLANANVKLKRFKIRTQGITDEKRAYFELYNLEGFVLERIVDHGNAEGLDFEIDVKDNIFPDDILTVVSFDLNKSLEFVYIMQTYSVYICDLINNLSNRDYFIAF
ncbi:hypothetical protein K8R33_01415 [archaeon]|nr:hypothetical protein [archaeon]